MKVTFIGLGIMGSRMAQNLIRNKVDITLYNRSPIKGEILKFKNLKIANSIKLAVQNADLVLSMLSNPQAVEEVFFGMNGALSSMKDSAIWVDCSTVNPSFSLRSSIEAERNSIRFIEAPVAGSKPQAQNADLVFFVGGPSSLIEIVKPYFYFMGKKVLHIGDIGQGASFKLIVNIMLAQSMLIFSEAVLLGDSLGLNQELLFDLLPNLVVSAPFIKYKAESIKAENYDVQFPLEHMHKDLHLATLTAYEKGQPLYLTNLTKELFGNAKKIGMGGLDFSAIHKYLEKE